PVSWWTPWSAQRLQEGRRGREARETPRTDRASMAEERAGSIAAQPVALGPSSMLLLPPSQASGALPRWTDRCGQRWHAGADPRRLGGESRAGTEQVRQAQRRGGWLEHRQRR